MAKYKSKEKRYFIAPAHSRVSQRTDIPLRPALSQERTATRLAPKRAAFSC